MGKSGGKDWGKGGGKDWSKGAGKNIEKGKEGQGAGTGERLVNQQAVSTRLLLNYSCVTRVRASRIDRARARVPCRTGGMRS